MFRTVNRSVPWLWWESKLNPNWMGLIKIPNCSNAVIRFLQEKVGQLDHGTDRRCIKTLWGLGWVRAHEPQRLGLPPCSSWTWCESGSTTKWKYLVGLVPVQKKWKLKTPTSNDQVISKKEMCFSEWNLGLSHFQTNLVGNHAEYKSKGKWLQTNLNTFKASSLEITTYHRITVPGFLTFLYIQTPPKLVFPNHYCTTSFALSTPPNNSGNLRTRSVFRAFRSLWPKPWQGQTSGL